jgi:hypothetical protein
VVVLHTEDSKWSAEEGLKYTYLFAGAKKVDANPHEPLSERAAGDIQAEVDRQYEQFTATVARNRSADVDAIIATQAGTLWGEGAIPLLADEVGTIDDALNALRQLLGESSQCLTAAMAATSFTEVKATMDKEKLLVAAEGQEPDEDDKKNNNDDGESEFCHACGTRLKEGAKFCHACGEPVGGGTVKGDARKEGSGAPAGLSLIEGAVHNVRPEGDIAAISALCKMAGCPNKTIEFVMAKNAKGQLLTVAEVSEALAADRVAESEKRMIHSHVNPNAGSGGVHEIEAQAASLARQNNGQATPGLYVTGTAVKLTKERAYAQMIEAHPEAYEAFRGQHNAAPLVAQLQRAGVRMIQ